MSGVHGAGSVGAREEEARDWQRSLAARGVEGAAPSAPPVEVGHVATGTLIVTQSSSVHGAVRRGAGTLDDAVGGDSLMSSPPTLFSIAPPLGSGSAAPFASTPGASTDSAEAVRARAGDVLDWGERVFVPGGSIASIILNYVPIKRAAHIASISSVLRDTIMAHAWKDEFTEVRDVAAWHAAFPNAVACSVAKEAALRDADCAHLAHVRMLTLPADTCELTDAGFAQLRALEELRMNWIKLRHSCPHLFTHLREVRVLHMSGWRSGAITPDLLRTLHRVVELDLSCNPLLNDEALAAVPYSCTTLNISLCRGITAAGIAKLTQVRDLDLSFNSDLSNDAVRPLSSTLRTLRVMSSSSRFMVLPDVESVLPGVTIIRTA